MMLEKQYVRKDIMQSETFRSSGILRPVDTTNMIEKKNYKHT